MLEKFRNLFSIELAHNYFTSKQFNQFSIVPAAATGIKMQRMEMLYRVRENKLMVLINEAFYETALTSNIRYLNFYIYLKDPYFYNYTNGNWENIQSAYFFFSNQQNPEPGADKPNRLHAGEFANETDLRTWSSKNVSLKKPFAFVSIYVDKDLQPVYEISFDTVNPFWAYILVSNHLVTLEQPVVTAKDNSVSFQDAVQIMLPNQRPALLIKSSEPIPLQERYKQYYTLLNKDNDSGIVKNIIQNLPGPDIDKISNVIKVLEKDSYKKTMEIYL